MSHLVDNARKVVVAHPRRQRQHAGMQGEEGCPLQLLLQCHLALTSQVNVWGVHINPAAGPAHHLQKTAAASETGP